MFMQADPHLIRADNRFCPKQNYHNDIHSPLSHLHRYSICRLRSVNTWLNMKLWRNVTFTARSVTVKSVAHMLPLSRPNSNYR